MKRMNPKARRWLLTFQHEEAAFGHQDERGNRFNGRWAIQWLPHHPNSVPRVFHFGTPERRDAWVAQNPSARSPLGKRNANVKAYRKRIQKENA